MKLRRPVRLIAGVPVYKVEIAKLIRSTPFKVGDTQLDEVLKESLRTQGQQYPISVRASGKVMDGERRIKALLELGQSEVEVIIVSNRVSPTRI